jgi:hypothetical protein
VGVTEGVGSSAVLGPAPHCAPGSPHAAPHLVLRPVAGQPNGGPTSRPRLWHATRQGAARKKAKAEAGAARAEAGALGDHTARAAESTRLVARVVGQRPQEPTRTWGPEAKRRRRPRPRRALLPDASAGEEAALWDAWGPRSPAPRASHGGRPARLQQGGARLPGQEDAWGGAAARDQPRAFATASRAHRWLRGGAVGLDNVGPAQRACRGRMRRRVCRGGHSRPVRRLSLGDVGLAPLACPRGRRSSQDTTLSPCPWKNSNVLRQGAYRTFSGRCSWGPKLA